MATDNRTSDGSQSERSGQAFLQDDACLLQELVRQALQAVFDAASLEHAQVRLAEPAAEPRARYPQVADKLEQETEDTPAFFHFPNSLWQRIRTTNMLERRNEEVGGRTKVIRMFPNMASCLRLVTAHAMEQAAEWAAQAQYLDMSLLED